MSTEEILEVWRTHTWNTGDTDLSENILSPLQCLIMPENKTWKPEILFVIDMESILFTLIKYPHFWI